MLQRLTFAIDECLNRDGESPNRRNPAGHRRHHHSDRLCSRRAVHLRTATRARLPGASELDDDIAQLRDEHARDLNSDAAPPPLTDNADSIATYVHWLIDRDRKSTGLKSLQGKIWQEGYVNGTLKSQVFDDVLPAFERWTGIQICIFSSGSVLAQQLLFAYTDHGDLTTFISDYFDTNVGPKGDPESYRKIANKMNLQPNEILFISDVVAELEAATAAGMQTRLSIRPGNQPQPDPDRFQIGRIKMQPVAYRQFYFSCFTGSYNRIAFGYRVGHRFFTNNVFACFGGCYGMFGM